MGNVCADGLKDHPVLDVPYTTNFYSFLSPLHICLAASLAGIDVPDHAGNFTYCDLGCGNGLTPNTLAACYPLADFHAIDLNPEHVTNAQDLAEKGGLTNVRFTNATFEDALHGNFPEFDFIAVHGVYSWVSAEVRRDICTFAQKFLKPGGLMLVSYNAMPGWSRFLNIREYLRVAAAGKVGNTGARGHAALREIQALASQETAFFKRVPDAADFVGKLRGVSPKYLAHEFLNESWQPQYFTEVCGEFVEAGMAYCGSADIKSQLSRRAMLEALGAVINLPEEPLDREALVSLVQCEKFRRDVYCRDALHENCTGTKPLDGWVLGGSLALNPRQSHLPKVNPNLLKSLLPNILRGDRSVAEIKLLPALLSFGGEAIDGCIRSLLSAGIIQPFAQRATPSKVAAIGNVRLLNAFNLGLLRERIFRDKELFLASPVLGNGIRISPVQGLLLLAAHEVGLDDAPGWIWEFARAAGQPIVCNDSKIGDPEELAGNLSKEIAAIRKTLLPMLADLGVVMLESGSAARPLANKAM